MNITSEVEAMNNDRLTYYKAIVKASGLGDSGRNITVSSELADWDSEVPPMLDGILKLPVPQVDDTVLVFIADNWNQIEYYLPVDYAFSSLTNSATSLQIENTVGDVEVDAATTILLGAGASEYVALAEQVKSQLDDIETAISTLVSNFNAHTHVVAGVTAGPASVVAAVPSVPSGASYSAADVAATKVKAE